MDIIREDIAEKKRRKRIVMAAAGAAAILLITLGLSRLKPAAPTVEKSTIWMDTVKRGPMLRQVRGPGSLVVESSGIRVLSAQTDGRVERLLLEPGAIVQPDTVILEMSNPELQRDALDAEQALKAGQAELANTRVKVQRDTLDQKAAAATVESDYHQAAAAGGDQRRPLQGGHRRLADAQAVAGARRGARRRATPSSRSGWRSPRIRRRRRSRRPRPTSSSSRSRPT